MNRPYKQISAEILFSLPIYVIMGLTKSLPAGALGCATLGVWALPEAFAAAQMGGRKTKAKLAINRFKFMIGDIYDENQYFGFYAISNSGKFKKHELQQISMET